MDTTVIDINSLVQDDHNFNKGTEEGGRLMQKSFTELGAGRSILIDKDNRIIAGNKSQQAAIASGITKVRVIETSGDELIAVKRTDISLDSKKGREMALADNITGQIDLRWDTDELESISKLEGIVIKDWGHYIPDILSEEEVEAFFENNKEDRKESIKIHICIPEVFVDKIEEIKQVVRIAIKKYDNCVVK